MVNEVFVNNREVACKAAEGKSVAAFPDVCFTPPRTQGSPPGIPIPYPNTAYAKDTANGSKTVMITGKQVVLKDKSYFKTSTGDEAGCADKGIKTGKIKGKAYFNSWSMNVFIEGYNVCRHLDLTTHNHGSMPGNTGVWKYIDTRTERKACKKEIKKVNRKCKPKKDGPTKKSKKVLDKSPGAWKKYYCKGLEFKLQEDLLDPKELQKKLDDLLDVSKQTEKLLAQAKDILIEKTKAWVAKKTAKIIGKSVIKGWLGPLGWALAAYDVVSAGIEINDMWDIIDDMKKDIENISKLPGKINELKKDGLTPSDVADAQELIAKVNPCLRARKCMLVPYNKSKQSNKFRDKNSGCCGGQTPHHLIPNAATKDSCPGYNYEGAPSVCAEGTSHGKGGSHESLHTYIEDQIKEAADSNGEMTYGKAKDIGAESHKKVFGNCSERCIKAQLDNYYKKKCGGDSSKVKAASAKGSTIYTNESKTGEI